LATLQESPELRDMCIASGVMPLLLELCMMPERSSPVSTVVWVVLNLCRGTPPPPRQDVIPAIPALAYTMRSNDPSVASDSLCSLSLLAQGNDSNQIELADCAVIPSLIRIIRSPLRDLNVLIAALRTIGFCVVDQWK
jgi:hypothetical protein